MKKWTNLFRHNRCNLTLGLALLIFIGLMTGACSNLATEADEFLTIIQPKNGTAWDVTNPIEVFGSAKGMPNKDVLIFVTDTNLNILGNTTATLGLPNDEGIRSYRGLLSASVSAETQGKIISVVFNDDGSVAGSAGVFVTMTTDAAFLNITEPPDGSTIPDPSSFTVAGSGAGLPENNVVVQVTDSENNVLAEQATTLSSDQVGGAGEWSVQFSIDVTPGTTGRIIAESQDPSSGGTIAADTIDVTYGG